MTIQETARRWRAQQAFVSHFRRDVDRLRDLVCWLRGLGGHRDPADARALFDESTSVLILTSYEADCLRDPSADPVTYAAILERL